MADSIPDRLAHVHPKSLKAECETDRKNFADLRPVIGHLVERALELLGISKQDAAFRMHYTDSGTVSRWCSGTERPLFDKLFAIDGFETAYVLAIAERTHSSAIEVETIVRIRRRA